MQEAFMNEMRILSLAAEQGPNVLFCIPNRTKCILLSSVMSSVAFVAFVWAE
jgi:hypothetical protein